MRTVRISLRTAHALMALVTEENWLRLGPADERAVAELRAAMEPKRSVVASRKRKDSKKKTKREETAEIRAAVMERAQGRCELCDHGAFPFPLELHHVLGRVRARQSERNCLALCYDCHRAITRNAPDARTCLEAQLAALVRLGHHETADKLTARIAALDLVEAAKEATP